MVHKFDFTNLDCTIIIKTIKERRPWLNSALKFYNDLYKGLKVAIVETSDDKNSEIKNFKNLSIIYKWGSNFSCEGALYEVIRLANTKYLIEQGDDDLILAERLPLVLKLSKIFHCPIVSFESLMINELDRDLLCQQRIRKGFSKSLHISSLILRRGLYQSTPNTSLFSNRDSRLKKFKKKYMMTEFSVIETETSKKIHSLEWITPKGMNGIGEATASMHAYVGHKVLRIPIIVFLRLETMNEFSPAAKDRKNSFKSKIAKEYAINYFKKSASYLNLNKLDIKMGIFSRAPKKITPIKKFKKKFYLKIQKLLVSVINIFAYSIPASNYSKSKK